VDRLVNGARGVMVGVSGNGICQTPLRECTSRQPKLDDYLNLQRTLS